MIKDQTTMAAKAESSDESGVKLLSGTNDQYGGVIVHIIDPMDPACFLSFLNSSIAHWKLEVNFYNPNQPQISYLGMGKIKM